jgi:NADPH:quinone reductase-like Zn-dependent oxidoreductase
MKAYYLKSYNNTDGSVYGTLPDPIPGKDQILVSVKAVSINPIDFKIKNGDLRLIVGSSFPKVIGSDFSGIVEKCGEEIKGFKQGDRVYGAIPVIQRKQGALAEYVITETRYTRHIPEGVSFEEAASLPVAALTALNGLRRCGVRQGTEILINGATGGVGHFAVQIARSKGAVITATSSSENAGLATKLGADFTSGYKKEDLKKIEKKFDAILDAYGKMDTEDICRLLKPGGTYATTLFFGAKPLYAFLVRLIFRKKLTSANMRSLPEDYSEIENLITGKQVIPLIENIFPLEKASEAFNFAENGKPKGKIIVKV